MWSTWGRTSGKTSDRLHSNSPNFSCSSFKDIQNLCKDEEDQHQHQEPQSQSQSQSQSRGPQQQPHNTKKPSVFHRVRISTSVLRNWNNLTRSTSHSQPGTKPEPIIQGAEKRIVVYSTSLRVVRRTFEACKTVQSILNGFRIQVDERDLSMDVGFLREVQGILGQTKEEISTSLPKVFVGGRYIGGAEEIRQLHETGELKKLVEGWPTIEPGVCEGCGGYRFVCCDQCDGSRKCYLEKGGFRTCLNCNENGLIKCTLCTLAPP